MPDNDQQNKQRMVVNALRALYLHLASGVAVWIFYVHRTAEQYQLWIGDLYVLSFFVFGFWVAFILEIRKGMNWARITYVVLFGLSLLICLGITIWLPSHSPFHSFAFYVQTSLGIIACACLLCPEMSAWCRERTERADKSLPLRWPMDSERKTIHDFEATPAEEPLLVVKYRGYKEIWRVLWTFFMAAFGGLLACAGPSTISESVWERLGFMVIILIFVIGGLGMCIQTVLFGDIRLYRDRMVQTRRLRRDIKITLADASYLCATAPRTFMRSVTVFKQGPKKWRARRKGIRYEENMMAAKDVTMLHRLLADLTGRNASDFEQPVVDLEWLMKKERVQDR